MAVRIKVLMQCRFLSFWRHNCSLSVDRHEVQGVSDPVAVIKLDNPPVNALTLPLLTQLSDKLKELNESSSVAGIVLASSLKGVFSAGIELNELYNPDTERLKLLSIALQNTWLGLYSSPHPTMAAINGHCLAGGTLLAAASDYRVGNGGKYKLGVTAARIGVVAPVWFQQTLVRIVGHRNTELMLTQAKLYLPSEALGIGLLDEVYDGNNDLVYHCIECLKPFIATSPASRRLMKQQLRAELVNEFLSCREKDSEDFVAFVSQTSVQKHLGEYIQKLKRKQ